MRKYITEDGKIIYAKNFKHVRKLLEGVMFFDAYELGRQHSKYMNQLIKKSLYFVRGDKRGKK